MADATSSANAALGLHVNVAASASLSATATITAGSAHIRVTQAPVEVLVTTNPDLRVTQAPVEVLVATNPDLRVTQAPVEVLLPNIWADLGAQTALHATGGVTTNASLSATASMSPTWVQSVVAFTKLTASGAVSASASLSATASMAPSSADIRVTQFGVENVVYGGNANIRVTQFGVEIIAKPGGLRFVPMSVDIRQTYTRTVPMHARFGGVTTSTRTVPLHGRFFGRAQRTIPIQVSFTEHQVPVNAAFLGTTGRSVPMFGEIGYRRYVPLFAAFEGFPARGVPIFLQTRTTGHVPLIGSFWAPVPTWKIVSDRLCKVMSLASHLVGGHLGSYLGFPIAINAPRPLGWDTPAYDDTFWPSGIVANEFAFSVPFPHPDASVVPLDFDWQWPNPTGDYAQNSSSFGGGATIDPWTDIVLVRRKFGLPKSQKVVNATSGTMVAGTFAPYFILFLTATINGQNLPFKSQQLNNFGGVVTEWSVPSSVLLPGTNVVAISFSSFYSFSAPGRNGGFQLNLIYRPPGQGMPQIIG